jgi:hypothetical protein
MARSDAFVPISEELAGIIDVPAGTKIDPSHGSFVGQHVYVVAEGSVVKVVVDPLDRNIPLGFQAKNYHHPAKPTASDKAAKNEAMNTLMSAAVAFAKTID